MHVNRVFDVDPAFVEIIIPARVFDVVIPNFDVVINEPDNFHISEDS